MAPNRKIFALKRIRLQGRDREAASGFIDEITLLQRLRGQRNIIQLLDSEVSLLMEACNLANCCSSAPAPRYMYAFQESHKKRLLQPVSFLCPHPSNNTAY